MQYEVCLLIVSVYGQKSYEVQKCKSFAGKLATIAYTVEICKISDSPVPVF